MSQLNDVNIEEESTKYNIKLYYHSDLKCENYDVELIGVSESDGRITIKPGDHPAAVGFVFDYSDPDRVIAIAQMMMAFAQMVKNENKKRIDTNNNE